jgi:pyruvate,water dikinase
MARSEIQNKLKESMMDSMYEKIMISINELQELIVNLSDLKDLISRFNFVVKRFTKTLAKLYLKKGILDKENDIWYLGINTIYDYTEGEINNDSVKDIVERNKLYYNSYRNYKSEENIGYIHSNIEEYDYEGIGCSTDIVKGRVRIIKSLGDLSSLTSNDIFVTKSINVNLLFQLPTIRGIIISSSNVSSSVLTIIRELKIPCIILKNCSKKLTDNLLVLMDGATGRIKIVKK